jgi:hypothetical protein
MEFTDLQTIITVMVVLTVAALIVVFDCRKKQREQRPEPVQTRDAALPRRPLMLFDAAPLEYASAKKLAAERPLEPVVATPTVSKPPTVTKAAARETVTVQMSGPNGMSSSQEASLPAFTIDAALWERLVASMPKHDLLTSGNEESEPTGEKPAPVIAIAQGALNANYQVIQNESQPAWPTGMIQQPAFQKLLDDGEPFSGLVVSIGINESDSSMWHSQGLMQSVGGYIAGLLRETDFSCRTAYDEFIVVCCGEHGAQSQRRLNHFSERLWDYQLRGIGACSILFSWGGVQVQDQPLAEAVASAVERMRQTKRGSSAGLAGAHRMAV